MKGQVIKGIAGFYYVLLNNEILEVKARGALKNDGKISVGDFVEVSYEDKVILKVYDRENQFSRPPISNIDMLFVTFSCASPEPNFSIIDKVLIMAEKKNVPVKVIINKVDLLSKEELDNISSIYNKEYDVILVSTKDNIGLEKIKEIAKGKTIAFSGPSGVGKSSIISKLIEKKLEVGSLSLKTNRGKHTTRHVEIMVGEDFKIFDTPGFVSFDLEEILHTELKLYYHEFFEYSSNCKYDNCMHLNEPNCSIKQAVREGLINKTRYLSYKQIINEIRENKKY